MPWDVLPWRPRIHLGLFVHRVNDLPPGLYMLARDPEKVETLRQAMRPEFCGFALSRVRMAFRYSY